MISTKKIIERVQRDGATKIWGEIEEKIETLIGNGKGEEAIKLEDRFNNALAEMRKNGPIKDDVIPTKEDPIDVIEEESEEVPEGVVLSKFGEYLESWFPKMSRRSIYKQLQISGPTYYKAISNPFDSLSPNISDQIIEHICYQSDLGVVGVIKAISYAEAVSLRVTLCMDDVHGASFIYSSEDLRLGGLADWANSLVRLGYQSTHPIGVSVEQIND